MGAVEGADAEMDDAGLTTLRRRNADTATPDGSCVRLALFNRLVIGLSMCGLLLGAGDDLCRVDEAQRDQEPDRVVTI